MFRVAHSHRWTVIHRVALASFLGQLFFHIPVVTPYLLARGLDLVQINGLQAILIVTQLILEVPTGVIADRIGRRWSLTLAAGAQLLGELTFMLARDYSSFVAAQVFAGAGYALASGSKDALVYDSLPSGDRTQAMQRAMGVVGGATQAASVIAYAVGGAMAASLGVDRISFAIGLTVVAMIAAFIATFAIHEPAIDSVARERVRAATLVHDGVVLLRSNAALRRIVGLYVLTNAFGTYLLLLYQAYFLQSRVPGIWFGLALSIASLLAIIAQRYAYLLPNAVGARRGLLVATALPGALYLLMALTLSPFPAVVLFCLQWGATFISGPLFSGYLNAHIPSSYRATALSLINLVVSVYLVVMGPIIGRVAEASLSWAFTLMGCLVLVGALTARIEERHIAHNDP